MQVQTRKRRWWHIADWSIRIKVLFSLTFVALLPMVIYAVIGGIFSFQNDMANSQAWLARDAQAAADQIQNNVNSVLDEVYVNSQKISVQSQAASHAQALIDDPEFENAAVMRDRTEQVLQQQLLVHPNYIAMRLLTSDGLLLAFAGDETLYPSLLESDQRDLAGYQVLAAQDATTEDGALLLPMVTDPVSGEVLFEAATIVSNGRTLYGYLVYTLDPQRILYEPMQASLSHSHTYALAVHDIFMVDGDGWLITPLHYFDPFDVQIPVQSAEVDVESEDVNVATYTRNWGGGDFEVTGQHVVIERLGWTVVSETAMDAIVEPLMQDLFFLIMIALVSALVLMGVFLVIMDFQMVQPVGRITRAAQQIAAGDLNVESFVAEREDEIGQLNRAVGTMTDNLRLSFQEMGERVQARTRDLELTNEITREASMVANINELLDRSVDLIVSNFDAVYHAQVFLVDERNEYADLIASTGEPGRALLGRGHRLAVGSVSVIGRVTELGETVIARDTSDNRVHRRNEFLPDTRAELALPLMYGDQMLGALDVQSMFSDAFTAEDQYVFETLAAQLAVAISNAQRIDALHRQISEVESRNRRLTRTNWQELLQAARRPGYLQASAGRLLTEDTPEHQWSRWQRRAAQQRDVVMSDEQADGTRFIAVPLVARDALLGVVEWQVPAERVTEHTMVMARDLAARLTTNLETVRLLERTERLAERERLVNTISGKLTSEPNVSFILQTAIDELADALQTSKINIQLANPTRSPMASSQAVDPAPTNGNGPTERA